MGGIKFIVDMGLSSLVYAAIFIFAAGVFYKVYFEYYKTPQPLKIPQTPQPTDSFGVLLRMAGDVLFFRSLAKGTRLLFAAGWVFHFTFLLLLIRHLRYFIYPVPGVIAALGNASVFIGIVMLLAMVVLVVRRFLEERVQYVTLVADYFVLFLIIAIVCTGIMLRYEPFRPDVTSVKAFTMELLNPLTPLKLITMEPAHAPSCLLFAVHLGLVCLLLIYFPFSKLMHSVGYFFSPTRNMVNNPRSVRYINPWDKG
ncbi:MAG: respiratory nitrate reductase subunit gamma [Nitrospirae bacterium]|nr:respiratory nitrate reductase subunit gamma [Nitrospirota bacterium]MBF0592346.1 respiratory nitrate reductase subunit gamma [Nitrospirota bacterium]